MIKLMVSVALVCHQTMGAWEVRLLTILGITSFLAILGTPSRLNVLVVMCHFLKSCISKQIKIKFLECYYEIKTEYKQIKSGLGNAVT